MLDENGPLRELFDQIDAGELKAMQSRHEEESLNLDFKRMDPSGEPSDADKRNLREAISGYANSAGGILLWGVESKSAENRGDRSRFQGLVPLRDGDRASVRFHELTATATQPAVSGVVHRAIAVDGGYVVRTFVPASDGGPHRTNETNGQYYRRDADAFRAMQHHEIAGMFGRRVRPRLELASAVLRRPSSTYGTRAVAELILAVRNVGRGIARFPRIVLIPETGSCEPARYGLDDNGKTNLRLDAAMPGSSTIAFSGGADDVVHPGGILEVTKLGLLPGPDAPMKRCAIRYSLFAEGMQPVEDSLNFTELEYARIK